VAGAYQARLRPVALAGAPPRPGVAEPERRQNVERRRVRTAVGDRHADQNIVGRGLRVLDGDVEITTVVEDARVDQLELRVPLPAAPALLDQPRIRVLALRILVERPQIGAGGRRVEVEVALLHVLAVIALGTGEAEEPLLEDGVATVPERDREAEPAFAVGDPEEPVFAPAVRAAPRVVVRQVVPARPVGRVILPHRSPLALGQVGPPALPVALTAAVLLEAALLRRVHLLSHGVRASDPHRASTTSITCPSGSRTINPFEKPSSRPGSATAPGETSGARALPSEAASSPSRLSRRVCQ